MDDGVGCLTSKTGAGLKIFLCEARAAYAATPPLPLPPHPLSPSALLPPASPPRLSTRRTLRVPWDDKRPPAITQASACPGGSP